MCLSTKKQEQKSLGIKNILISKYMSKNENKQLSKETNETPSYIHVIHI